jgi:hypothetical protein
METALCSKNRLSSTLRFLVIATVLLFLGSNGPERDLYRSDVLTFHGDKQFSADTLPSDSFLVTLDCKEKNPTQTPPKYTIILRGTDPVERALFQDAQDGKWDRFDLFRAAMVAEGIRDIELIRTYEAQLNALVEKVSRANGNTSPQALTRALFEAMHKEILTKPYSLDCTELSKVLKTGHFNCVSATILFNCLADKAGLDVCAIEMPGHALSRVKFGNGMVMDLETTCPTWFDLQSDKERQMATLQRIAPTPAIAEPPTAQNAVPATPEPMAELPSDRREINPVQLIATVYYNTGVDLHNKKSHPEAAAANVKALYLDKYNEQAWTNLLVSINNWALDAVSEKRGEKRLYNFATVLLDQGVALDPTYANFRANYTYVFYHWIHGLATKGQFDDARQVFAHASVKDRIPGNKDLLTLMDAVNQEEARIKASTR